MFQVSVEETFSSGHALRGYRGKCENVHGHNYRVRVTVEGPQLDSIGLLCDFTEVKRVLREIIRGLDHQFINDLEAFRTVNPSAENLAKYFYDEVTRQLTAALPAVARVTDTIVWETDTASAQYRPGV
jgi:6-pyruvoyltetrahydropterin/6-carboxytetrahydropterin synthase